MVTERLQLKIMTPTQVVLELAAGQVNVDAKGGSRGLLPRHIDFVATLTPGILTYLDENGQEGYAAVDGGVLIKKGTDLLISTPDAVHSHDLEQLESFIQNKTQRNRDLERANRGTMARLEVALVRRMMELRSS